MALRLVEVFSSSITQEHLNDQYIWQKCLFSTFSPLLMEMSSLKTLQSSSVVYPLHYAAIESN